MAFVNPTTLAAHGVKLVPLAHEHEAGLQTAAADGQLWQLRVTSVPEPDQTGAYIETALKAREAGHRFAFAVLDEASNTVLGSTSYHDILPDVRRVEIGYTWYAKRVQRTHVNTACKLLLLTHAFDDLKCHVVGWRTDNFNFASQRAIERLGARKNGVIRGHALQKAAMPYPPSSSQDRKSQDRKMLERFYERKDQSSTTLNEFIGDVEKKRLESPRAHIRWEEPEKQWLRQLAEQGLPTHIIAETMERPQKIIENRLKQEQRQA